MHWSDCLLPLPFQALFIDSTSAGNWSFKRRMQSAQPMIASIYLKVKLRETFRKRLKEYVSARIELYRRPHDFSLWDGAEVWSEEQQNKIQAFKTEVWKATVAVCPPTNFHPACPLAVSALGNVFDIARLRAGAAEKHPPHIVYVMLFGLGLGGSLLAGFGMAAAKARSWIHMVGFAATLAATLYVITDLEFPRLGLVRIDDFDHFLVDAYEQMRVRE